MPQCGRRTKPSLTDTVNMYFTEISSLDHCFYSQNPPTFSIPQHYIILLMPTAGPGTLGVQPRTCAKVEASGTCTQCCRASLRATRDTVSSPAKDIDTRSFCCRVFMANDFVIMLFRNQSETLGWSHVGLVRIWRPSIVNIDL